MNSKELLDYVLQHMTAEEALLKMLQSGLIEYDKLKFSEEGKEIHPIMLISMAAWEMGWDLAVEKNQEDVRGLACGTSEYLDSIFKKEK